MVVITSPDMAKSLQWKWQVSALLAVGILSVILQVECSLPAYGRFNPENSPDDQPMTFLPPIPNNDCSVYKPETYWHFINSYSGRCCLQIFVTNGMFGICDVNGGHDQLVDCPNGSYNWRSPFFSGKFQFPDQAKDLCRDKESVVGGASPNITWNYKEFIRREGTSVILQGTVYSASDLVAAYLFKNKETLPLGEMEYRKLADTDGVFHVGYKLTNLTLGDDGLYSILATNKQTSTMSRKARLTVLHSHSGIGYIILVVILIIIFVVFLTGTFSLLFRQNYLSACVCWKCRTNAVTDNEKQNKDEKSDVEDGLIQPWTDRQETYV